jgi:hypothetical protein
VEDVASRLRDFQRGNWREHHTYTRSRRRWIGEPSRRPGRLSVPGR